jgi:hypothetical protein
MVSEMRGFRSAPLLLPLLILLFSCATAGKPEAPREIIMPLFYGEGYGPTSGDAREAAGLDAARKAAESLLGPASSMNNRNELDRLFFSAETARFVQSESCEVIEESRSADEYRQVVRCRIDLAALLTELKEREIYGGQVTPDATEVSLEDEPSPSYIPTVREATSESDGVSLPQAGGVAAGSEGPSPELVNVRSLDISGEEKERLAALLDDLSFMVYFNPDAREHRELLRRAVLRGNEYLESGGFAHTDPEQIDTILAGELGAYEDETGGSVDLLRWTASKLNADIIIVVDGDFSANGGRPARGSAQLSLECFTTLDGAMTGRSRYRGEASAASGEQALRLSVDAAMNRLFPEAVSVSLEAYRDTLLKGLPYELVLLNYGERRDYGPFIDALESRLRKLSVASQSSRELHCDLMFLGNVEELESLIYETAARLPGMEQLSLVFQRGNSLIFDAGLQYTGSRGQE